MQHTGSLQSAKSDKHTNLLISELKLKAPLTILYLFIWRLDPNIIIIIMLIIAVYCSKVNHNINYASVSHHASCLIHYNFLFAMFIKSTLFMYMYHYVPAQYCFVYVDMGVVIIER